MDLDTLKQYGIAGVMFLGFLWLLRTVGLSLVEAIKQLGNESRTASKAIVDALQEHTTVDLAHHAEVNESIADLRARFDVIQDITPIDDPRRRVKTPARGVPAGEYSYSRPKTRDDR